MTQECLDSKIIDIQCDHVDLSSKLVNYLSIGSPKVICYNRKNVSVMHVLKILKCYQAFTSDITFATKITFDRITAGDVQVDLFLDFFLYTPQYIGSGTGEEIAAYYENLINNTTHPNIDYEPVVRLGNTLYIYSYDPAATFNDNVLVNSLDTSLVTSTVTNMQNTTSEILDIWNSITYDELCCLIDFAKNQVKVQVGSSNSNPCNC